MLTVTTDAAEVIRGLMESGAGGLRISTGPHSLNGQGPALHVELAEAPEVEDEVVDVEGAQVFVDPAAAEALDDKVLDAETDGGEVAFAVREQE
jgi:iron-sulfur cluster assembly protein